MTRWVDRITGWCGSYPAIGGALVIVVAWLAGGLAKGQFDDKYQLPINTFTTIVTFLMVFCIQNSANRSDRATHAKLDELLTRLPDTDSGLAGLEELPEKDIIAAQHVIREREGS